MTDNKSPNASTFDLVPPRRPSLDDFNGAEKEDVLEEPPEPKTMPSAAEYNTICRLVEAIGRVTPVAIVDVKFASGAPIVERFACVATAADTGTFVVADAGNGVTDVHWPSTLLPSPSVDPVANVTENVAINSVRTYPMPSPPPGRVGVRVTTQVSGTGTDARFQLRIH